MLEQVDLKTCEAPDYKIAGSYFITSRTGTRVASGYWQK